MARLLRRMLTTGQKHTETLEAHASDSSRLQTYKTGFEGRLAKRVSGGMQDFQAVSCWLRRGRAAVRLPFPTHAVMMGNRNSHGAQLLGSLVFQLINCHKTKLGEQPAACCVCPNAAPEEG